MTVFRGEFSPRRALDALSVEFKLRHRTCHVSKQGNLMTCFVSPSLTMVLHVINKMLSVLAGLQLLCARFFNFFLITFIDHEKTCILC
jgi:hypothetical protein